MGAIFANFKTFYYLDPKNVLDLPINLFFDYLTHLPENASIKQIMALRVASESDLPTNELKKMKRFYDLEDVNLNQKNNQELIMFAQTLGGKKWH
ncbi:HYPOTHETICAL PROTEIN MCJ_004840 [Mesomycoplasma conjunctivae]|uniref:Uncharacterized protein n=1 Tax=Mesomycoplasma conjunctivae (strain ATCC 25834 / NCTC 10147 / HRC/581) TaxID=572263 RepID=C5J6S6_MESCH|nr:HYPOTHETICAL PROTEIN MCJ_004840 [Mesomycoplasma conjunctivae]